MNGLRVRGAVFRQQNMIDSRQGVGHDYNCDVRCGVVQKMARRDTHGLYAANCRERQ